MQKHLLFLYIWAVPLAHRLFIAALRYMQMPACNNNSLDNLRMATSKFSAVNTLKNGGDIISLYIIE